MRSNDAIFGYNSDRYWANHVMTKMVDDLNRAGLRVIKGDIIWNAGSLHVYERHFKFLK